MSETHVDVAPGGEASVEVHIRNTGRNVDRVDLGIEGVADGWTVVEPGTTSLLPGAGTVARLVLRPRGTPACPPGSTSSSCTLAARSNLASTPSSGSA